MSHIIKPAKKPVLNNTNNKNNNQVKSFENSGSNSEVEEVDFAEVTNPDGFDVSLEDLSDVEKLNKQIINRDIELL